jgi:hypothetical protein
LAQQGHVSAFSRLSCPSIAILFQSHGNELFKHWLSIISSIPETVHPSSYERLLPSVNEKRTRVCITPVSGTQEDEDCTHCHGILGDAMETLDFVIPSVKEVSEWYCHRAVEIDRLSGQLENSKALIELGLKKNVPDLKYIQSHLASLCYLVYDASSAACADISLHEYMNWDNMKRINLLFADLSSSSTDFNNRLFLSRFNTCFFELVNLLWFGEDRLDGSYSEASTLSGIKGLLFDFIKELSHSHPEVVFLILLESPVFVKQFKKGKDISNFPGSAGGNVPLLLTREEIVELGVICAFRSTESTPEALSLDALRGLVNNLQALLPDSAQVLPSEINNDSREGLRTLLKAREGLDALVKSLRAFEICRAHGMARPLASFTDWNVFPQCPQTSLPLNRKQLIRELCQSGLDPLRPYSPNQWRQLYVELHVLQKLLSVPTDVINKQFMESLLSSSSLKNIRLASEFIQNCRHHQFLPIPLIDLHEISGVILKVAIEYYNTCNSMTDPLLEAATGEPLFIPLTAPCVMRCATPIIECLNLIPEGSCTAPVIKEKKLISAVKLMHVSFRLPWTPLQGLTLRWPASYFPLLDNFSETCG